MVFADARTHSVASQSARSFAGQPAALGFANTAMDWGGVRWSAIAWQGDDGTMNSRPFSRESGA